MKVTDQGLEDALVATCIAYRFDFLLCKDKIAHIQETLSSGRILPFTLMQRMVHPPYNAIIW